MSNIPSKQTPQLPELDKIELLRIEGEAYGICLEENESADRYANRILDETAEMIDELKEAQGRVLEIDPSSFANWLSKQINPTGESR